jgi:hypothetical protein
MIRRQLRPLTIILAVLAAGCDHAYRYLFYPPEVVEYTLVPDLEMLSALNDTSLSINRDTTAIVYSRGNFKIEVKYVPDYQLNNVEFPEESRDFEFSSNPFTYANWVDPKLGVTPNRFSVFRVSIYNYSAPKLNFDPERSFLLTDRGDLFNGYGREEKTSKNFSLEAYYKRRKGASGVEDEIFERRMGIIRTTVLYLGRPVYAGDNREGFVVYDPLDESVQQVKLVFKDFILGYDENNEPSEFTSIDFYFRRVPLRKETIEVREVAADTTKPEDYRTVEIHQIRYRPPSEEEVAAGTEEWNAQPRALSSLSRFLRDSLRIKATIKTSSGESSDLANAQVLFMFAGPSDPVLTDVEVAGIADVLKKGSVIVIDNAAFSTKYQYPQRGEQLLEVIGSKMGPEARVGTIGLDHAIFRSWKKLTALPEGMDDRENMPGRRDYLMGLTYKNRLVGIMSTKAYSMVWDRGDAGSVDQLTLGANIVQYAITR